MKVAAVVPHWNRRVLLQTLLANLRQQIRPFDEIIVVDNGSTDDSVTLAEKAGARVIQLDRNLGFAAAVNRGIQATNTEWIAILNNDVTLEASWLATLLDAAKPEGVWFATGKVLRANDPSYVDGAFDEISRGACAYRCGSGKPDGPLWNQPRRIRIAPMTAALFRRELFEKVGVLDESFESYLEDVDFGIRCGVAGYGGVYEPRAISYHLESSTWGRWNKYAVRLISRNQVLLTAKYFRGAPRWPLVAGQLLWALVALRHRCIVGFVQGKIAGVRFARSVALRRQAAANFSEIEAFIEESDQTIREIQQQTGFDLYWRAYFWLLGR